MKIFIVGMPQSGRTTISQELSKFTGYQYIDCSQWIRHTFRDPKEKERIQQYDDEYYNYLVNRLKVNPLLCVNHVNELIETYGHDNNYIIDGVFSPKDLVHLFDYNTDYIIFLNRTDNDAEYKDYENIGVSTMRDYCYWLSSASLLPKERWIELNFKIPGEDSDYVKVLGSKNTIYLTKNFKKALEVIRGYLVKN